MRTPSIVHGGVLSALATALCLIGGILVGVVAGTLTHDGLSGHLREPVKIGVAALSALAGVLAGGAAWGALMAQIVHIGARKRMAWAGALGFGPTAIAVGLVLTVLEKLIVEQGLGPRMPIHIVFTLLFVPAAAIISGVGGLALGLGLKRPTLARRLAWRAGLAGGTAFLAVDLLMDALGWRVGAPGAAEHFTMLTVMFSGDLVAALAAGALIGLLLDPPAVHSALESGRA